MTIKAIFVLSLSFLVVFSIYMIRTIPDRQSDRPVLYWKTDPNPQRFDQVDLFHKWLVEKGHVDDEGQPIVELRVDSANPQSKLIQAVSGVGGDIIDASVHSFQPMGLLTDLTPYADKLKFNIDTTFSGIKNIIEIDGKQYGYPCNVGAVGYWCNKDTFKRYGLGSPSEVWNPEEFEKIGKEFTKRANKGKERQDIFFAQSPCTGWAGMRMIIAMHRSLGLDDFNETLTRCTLDDPRYVRLLKLLYKWTYVDHLFPSAAEQASMSGEAGYGGGELSHFQHGKYAMIIIGRWCLIRIRGFDNPPQLSLSRFPMWGYQNMVLHARCATLYAGSKKKDLAKYFFAYLADKSYSDYIIKGADGLPPNISFAENNPDFESPVKHPNEGKVHKTELKWAKTLGISLPISPYFKSEGANWKQYGLDMLFNDKGDAEASAKETASRINASIKITISNNAGLKKKYLDDLQLQKKIDARKASNQKIPLSWIKNPFHRVYYKEKGLLE